MNQLQSYASSTSSKPVAVWSKLPKVVVAFLSDRSDELYKMYSFTYFMSFGLTTTEYTHGSGYSYNQVVVIKNSLKTSKGISMNTSTLV